MFRARANILLYSSKISMIIMRYQDYRWSSDGDEQVSSHKKQSPPNIPYTIPQVASTILQTVSQRISNMDHFLVNNKKVHVVKS